ncbi:cytochrome c3 family protein [Bacillus salipaludis]|uniref:Cytochrome c3 family protein n=1 Tax=Bacillus salipaludis TaxID=2547811 RepID=A0ABW8R9U6_9BACI
MRKFSLSFLFAIMLFGMFAAAALAAPNTQDPANNNPAPDISHNDTITPGAPTPKENANNTGDGINDQTGTKKGDVVKALQGQNVHKAYQNNTNSCASCHQTHTASGKTLLFADTVYQTCTACHDGTLGFANVFSNPKDTALDGAGTFGGSHATNMSIHMANDAVKIKAAPGGNPVGDTVAGSVQWGENFNCASCHAPHGSYSDRLLSYNPNGMGAVPVADGGNQLVDVPVVTDLTGQTEAFVLFKETLGDGNVKVSLYKKGTPYTLVESPWLYGYGSRTDGLTYFARLVKADGTIAAYQSTSGVYFDYQKGSVSSNSAAGVTALNSAAKGVISRPYIVKMDINKTTHKSNQAAYWSGAPKANFTAEEQAYLTKLGFTVGSSTVTGLGKAMSNYCAACHTDYYTSSSAGKTSHWGDEYAAYRHSTNSDSYTCVRCHYSHGTDAELMMDATGKRVSDIAGTDTTTDAYKTAVTNMTDANKSSALKKFTNMSVCWACHNSSHAESIKNTDTRPADHPEGMPKSTDGVQR